MIDLSDYKLAWQVYLSVGLVAGVIWCMLLRRIPVRVLRYWLMTAGIVFLFLPARHPDMSELWVPSAGAAVLTILTDGLETAVPMLLAMGMAQIGALIVAILLAYIFANGVANPKKTMSADGTASSRAEPDIGLD
ncbi:hypothetical protein [Zhongshania aliphaticivorans]|uniref:hypothetical protein n=1 Tax=Zhongshania aliphaticivorans TaxID=1470434 RepID=UPI0012E676FF|nr:hypothetical protein [Zhongshania aliphaticivorans]CAA0108135.1 Uncharacterised protein [Zhongshania aliphaticivorans]